MLERIAVLDSPVFGQIAARSAGLGTAPERF
jgi:hypothetical protein